MLEKCCEQIVLHNGFVNCEVKHCKLIWKRSYIISLRKIQREATKSKEKMLDSLLLYKGS
jgi:hypothetical protein